MKLPWVSRRSLTTLEADVLRLVDALNASTATVNTLSDKLDAMNNQVMRLLDQRTAMEERHERDVVRAEARYAELMASYRQLRLQGHAEPIPTPPIDKPLVDPVIVAVNAKAPDAKTRAAMLRQVAIDRKAELSDEEIIMRIQRGNRPAEEVQ